MYVLTVNASQMEIGMLKQMLMHAVMKSGEWEIKS